MELMTEEKKDFKQTEVGLIPEDWIIVPLDVLVNYTNGKAHEQSIDEAGQYIVVNSKFISTEGKVKKFTSENNCPAKVDDILMVMSDVPNGRAIAKCFYVDQNDKYTVNQRICLLNAQNVDSRLLFYILNRNKYYLAFDDGVKQTNLRKDDVLNCPIPLPPTLEEQQAIASALSDVDELIRSLDGLIQKKQAIKKGTMQQLLTGKKRLPGFDGKWEVKNLEDIADCLDNLRVPLNESQRNQMRGNIPYCGANGVLDYVDDYVVDDDIILMAEDGGYFDEYKTRPIAYRMKGKCWVNNHAHILKAKDFYNQSFLFYSLVHKDIQDYITGGTRAKLNKGSMLKIEVYSPNDKEEQKAIAQILSDMDWELQTLRQKREKYVQVKQGMMQELLTGKVRLV